MSSCSLVRIVGTCPFGILLIGLGMYFVHAVKADAHVLPRVDELDELFYGTVELSYNVLYCQHHTKCHTAMYHGSGSKYRDKYVFYLVDGNASGLLYLLKIE